MNCKLDMPIHPFLAFQYSDCDIMVNECGISPNNVPIASWLSNVKVIRIPERNVYNIVWI